MIQLNWHTCGFKKNLSLSKHQSRCAHSLAWPTDSCRVFLALKQSVFTGCTFFGSHSDKSVECIKNTQISSMPRHTLTACTTTVTALRSFPITHQNDNDRIFLIKYETSCKNWRENNKSWNYFELITSLWLMETLNSHLREKKTVISSQYLHQREQKGE